MQSYILLWLTQSLSQLGSSVTSFALSVWLYEKTGSALQSAFLLISSYAPYVLVSIFAGALSDKWKKKTTMLVCDSLAALCTIVILVLIVKDLLEPWHMYIINALTGLMNTFQEPASETAMTIITPKNCLQKASGLKSLSRSLISIFNPVIATTLYSFFGMKTVCLFDLFTFVVAFVVLAFFIEIRDIKYENEETKIFTLIKEGKEYLKNNKLILYIILFLSCINFVASSFDTIINPLVLSKTGNNEQVLGIVMSFSGIAMLVGSFIATNMKEPKHKTRTLYFALLISMMFENFMIAFSNSPIVWCIAQIIGWLPIPIFTACYDVIFKTTIPVEMQGRVYSFRNTLQFFTIPIGYFFGGFLVEVFERFVADNPSSVLTHIFGNSLGSGASIAMFVSGLVGVVSCIVFKNKLLNKNNM